MMGCRSPRTKLNVLLSVCCATLSVFYSGAASAATQVLTGHGNAVTAIAASPNGRLIASASLDRTVRLWNAQTGRLALVLRGHKDEVYTVAFSADNKRLASSSYDGSVIVWDATSGRRLQTLAVTDWSITLDFSPDSLQLAVGSQNRNVVIFDVQTGKTLRTLETNHPIGAIAFSPDGRYLAVGYRGIDLWDVQTNKIVKTLRQTGVSSIAFSRDGKLIASGSGDKSVRLWNVESGEQMKKLETDTPLVWQFGSGAQTVRLRLQVKWAAFSPDSKLVAMVTGRTIHLWDVATGNQVRTLEGHTKSVTGAVFMPDGKSLASSSLDKTIRIWSLTSQ